MTILEYVVRVIWEGIKMAFAILWMLLETTLQLTWIGCSFLIAFPLLFLAVACIALAFI